MKLSFEALEALDAIDRTGTFAEAAELLHRVPSALTYLVQKLESDLGVALFDRSGRLRLNDAGRLFRDHVQRGLGELDAGRRGVARGGKQGFGHRACGGGDRPPAAGAAGGVHS